MLLLLQDKREKQDKLAESNLYIKNLDDTQTDDKLRQLFEVGHPLPLLAVCRGVRSCFNDIRGSMSGSHPNFPEFADTLAILRGSDHVAAH